MDVFFLIFFFVVNINNILDSVIYIPVIYYYLPIYLQVMYMEWDTLLFYFWILDLVLIFHSTIEAI